VRVRYVFHGPWRDALGIGYLAYLAVFSFWSGVVRVRVVMVA